ncbi:response regulator transcription factor [Nocardia suismassiliense]|uniref:Response regulator transcription factor n=1 Tax=Nocardia suismassiliense TaxID=2077092 RepID=A0ABW6R0A7_9NOCA
MSDESGQGDLAQRDSLERHNSSAEARPPAWHNEAARAALLSSRENEVFWLLGSGRSNRAIAAQLQITERTVKAHVARIMAKLGVESRLQAGLVSYAYQLATQGSCEQQAIGHRCSCTYSSNRLGSAVS